MLTTDELTALGVKGIDGFADGDEAFGYRFGKHRQRNRTLWTVERCIGVKTLKQLDQAIGQKPKFRTCWVPCWLGKGSAQKQSRR